MLRNFFVCLLLTALFTACNPATETPNDSYDRKQMLINIADGVIIPAYNNFKTSTNDLYARAETFSNSPTADNLTALQQIYLSTHMAWQNAETYEFGPAETRQVRLNINTFPTDTAALLTLISGTSTIDENAITTNQPNTKGLSALDFLLFKRGAGNDAVLKRFTTDGQATRYKQYLLALTAHIKSNAAYLVDEWTGKGYRESFIAADGTAVGSSLGNLINQMARQLDVIKNQKLGAPLGMVGNSYSGTTYPERVEALQSNKARELMLENLNALENLYLGKAGGNNGMGIDDYLDYIDAEYNGDKLTVEITKQFDRCRQAINGLQPDVYASIKSDKTKGDKAFIEMKKLIVLMKLDVPSNLGIIITLNDNDGD